MPRCAVRMNVHLDLHGAHVPRPFGIGCPGRVHGADARSSERDPDERASGLASARHIGHHINKAYPTYCDRHGPTPTTMQKAVALAHLRVAAWEPDDDDEVVVPIPALPASPPQFLPVPSAWWETPAVTSRPLSPVPEEARTARHFVRELLTCWGLGYLSDDAELIIAELVGNAVRHGIRTAPAGRPAGGTGTPALRLCLLRRVGRGDARGHRPERRGPGPEGAQLRTARAAAACRSSARSATSGAGPRSRAAARPSGPC